MTNYDKFWENVLKEDEWTKELMKHQSRDDHEPFDSQRQIALREINDND